MRSPHWIPPLPLAAGLVFQLAAWAIALAYMFAPTAGLAFAWIHAVALGWVTLTALAVLLHVIPASPTCRGAVSRSRAPRSPR